MKRSERENKDRSITVRFSKKEAEALSSIATEYNTTLSDVVRCATRGELDKYLGKVKYVDAKQGQVINDNILAIGNAVMETLDNLRRIRVCFGMIAKKVDADDMSVLNDSRVLISKDELDAITHKLEKVTKEAGEVLLCIAG